MNIVQPADKYGVKKFVGVSSGGALSKEITSDEISSENDTPQLVSPYAISKFATEKYLDIYSKKCEF